MKTGLLAVACALLVFVAACESKLPSSNGGGSGKGPTAKIKAQSDDPGQVIVDGGLAEVPPTISYTGTGTQTATETVTEVATSTSTVTLTVTSTVTSTTTSTVTLTQTTTATVTGTSTTTSTATATSTGTATTTGTQTYTASATTTATQTQTLTATSTAIVTATRTQTSTATQTQTATQTASATATQTGTAHGTYVQNYVLSGTITSTNTAAVYYTSWPHTRGNTATATTSQFVLGTGTRSVTKTVTSPFNSTETKTVSATMLGSGTSTGTTTVTVTATSTSTVTNAGGGTRTVTATGTATNTAAQTWTMTSTTVVTRTVTATSTVTLTSTSTVTSTVTVTDTNTVTQTATQTRTVTLTNTLTSTNTRTVTATSTVTNTSTATNSSTATNTSTATGTSTYTQGQTATGTGTATGTQTGTATGTSVATGTATITQTVTNTLTATNPCLGNWSFCDNFENGNTSQWSVKQGSAADFSLAADGSIVYRQGDSSASSLHIARAGKMWMDQTVEAKLKPLAFAGPESSVALFGRYETTESGDCAYTLALRGDGTVALGKRINGVESPMGQPVPAGVAVETWYVAKLDIVGSTINGYLNGTLVLSQTDSACEVGSTGVGSVGTSFESDDVRVTAATVNACMQDWRNTACGQLCTGGTQANPTACGAFLDCYVSSGCGPESCGGVDGVCGLAALPQWGAEAKAVADQVYQCMGCPGSVRCGIPAKLDGTVCSDGNACTHNDSCQAGVCAGSDPVACVASDQCHGVGVCDPATGGCSNPVKDDGSPCDDGNACTQVDTCQTGTCTGGIPVTCAASDQCHSAGVCDSATGLCSSPKKDDGTVCDDANPCTQTDACQDGTCVGSNPVSCGALDQCHLPGTCDSATGLCSNPLKDDGSSCDDGNPCTQGDSCQSGTCVGTPATCGALDQCHEAGVCNPVTGMCTNPAKQDGTLCNDGNACTQLDRCQSGACVGSSPTTCTALDQCHIAGTCDPSSGACSNPPAPEGLACDDGNKCTTGDTCHAGACTAGSPVTCTASDACHVAGSCNPASGLCSNPTAPDGTTCNDNNPCTQTDACQAGSCVGTPMTCTALDQCHIAGTCDTATGACTNPIKSNGTGCSDGNACTQGDTCQAGACVGGTPVTCTALDQCHVPGTCDTATGTCSNPTKNDGSACDDGDKCTTGDTCLAGTCKTGTPVTCTALDACHVAGTCNPSTGACTNPNAANGTTCNDNNGCTTTDQCQNGTCTGSNPVTCTAPDQCHQVGACVPSTGACAYTPKPDGTSCNDSDLCTQTDTCQSGLCVGSNLVACSGGDQCQTSSTCDPTSGACLHTGKPNGTPCSDGDASTESDTCQMGVCVGIPTQPLPTVNTVAGNLAFLYQGPGASQIGVASGTIQVKRAAGVRGQVLAADGSPLSGVKVTIADHTEYGYTASGEDGSYELVVNGGGSVVVQLARKGYLKAERAVEVGWQAYADVDPVVLLATAPVATSVSPGLGTIQLAVAAPISDSDGYRQAVLAVPSKTTATMTLANGSKVALGSMNVRITEVTVGANGPAAMPAVLPATSAYTYAVSYTVDEALASGAKLVELSQPIYHYSENFLGFAVGNRVPAGYYDDVAHRWVASTDGRVIKILGTDSGKALVDVAGSGTAASQATLTAMGFTTEELSMLAGRYATGATLWRVPLTHFSIWDYNWPFGPPPDATTPNAVCSNPATSPRPTTSCGSIIENESQVLGERVAIPGTPFSLNYRSNRTPGFKAANELFLNLTGPNPPASVTEVLLRINAAGQQLETSLAPSPNLGYRFLWDGKDAFGRPVNGVVSPDISVGFRYPLVYTPLPAGVYFESTAVFGALAANPLAEGSRTRKDATGWQKLPPADVGVGTLDARGVGIGGWTINVHHALDNLNRMWLGDGSRRMNTVASMETVLSGPYGAQPRDKFAIGKDGTVYVTGWTGPGNGNDIAPAGAIHKLDPVTKTLSVFYSLQNIPTSLICAYNLARVTALEVAPDGSIYFSAYGPYMYGAQCGPVYIFRISPAGALLGYWEVGESAWAYAYSGIPVAIRVARDGTVYYLEARQVGSSYYPVPTCLRVMKLEADGRRSVVAGGDCSTTVRSQDPGPAASATFGAISTFTYIGYDDTFLADLAIGRDGSLYVANTSENAVRKISPGGMITTFAGGATPVAGAHTGDGGPATQATLVPTSLAVDDNDVLYIGDSNYDNVVYNGTAYSRGRVRAVSGGTIRTVAGSNTYWMPEGTPSLRSYVVGSAYGLAIAPSGALYILDAMNLFTDDVLGAIRKFALPLPWVGDSNATIASEDGSEVYVFDANSRHSSTRDALTGAVKYSFGYNTAGQVETITDVNSLVTHIERSTPGEAAVIAPNGQRTELTINDDGYLTGIQQPGSISHGYTYYSGDAQGLLASYTNPRSQTSTFTYDDLGRITGESMPGGCSWTIQRLSGPSTASPQAPVRVSLTSREGRTTTYQIGTDANGTENRAAVSSAGLSTTTATTQAAVKTTTSPDGMVTTVTESADPQYGLQATLASSVVQTPGGKQMSVVHSASATVDAANNLVSRVDSNAINGKATTSTFNAAAKTITSASPVGRQTVTTLDAKGRVAQVQAGNLAPTAYAYDPRGRLSSVTVGTGSTARVTNFGYDDLDRLSSVTDPLNRVQSYTYDDANRVVAQTFADLSQVAFSYDANGNVTSVTPPGRPAHAFGFTPNDLMSSYTPPVLSTEAPTTYEYNLDKQPTVIHRPDGTTINFTYDSAGRLATTTYPSVNGNVVVTRTYSSTTGQLTGVSTSDGPTVTYGYDGQLLTSRTWSGTVAGSVSRTYNNDFRVATELVNGANSVAYGYDNDGLLTSVDGLSITRDPTNGLIADTTLGSVTDHRTPDSFGQLLTYEAKFGSTSLYSAAYVRDSLGRIEQKTETTQGTTTVWNYSYDQAGRLWQVMQNGALTATYLYDANGNRTSVTTASGTQTATFDAQDRLLTYGNWSYTYTANGDLQSKTDTSNGQVTTYAYDAQGNLRHVSLPDGRSIDYVIDSENRRVAKKVNGVVVKKWLYKDQLKPVAEFDGSGTLVARYIKGVTIKGSTSYRVITDHLGTPRLLVNSTSGAVAQRLDVDEWGQVTGDSSAGFQVFGFAGGIYDPDTGLVRFGARDYDPVVGRWTAKDPIRFDGGQANFYVYALNDPVNHADQTGLGNGTSGLTNSTNSAVTCLAPKTRSRRFERRKRNETRCSTRCLTGRTSLKMSGMELTSRRQSRKG